MRVTDVVTTFAPGLFASGLEWMIAGGVAAIVYGEPRVTLDVDTVAAIRPEDAATLTAQFPDSLYYCHPPEIVAEEASRDAFGAFTILHQQGASIRHLDDIRSMLRVLGESVDTTALRAEASDLGLDLEWREMEDLSD